MLNNKLICVCCKEQIPSARFLIHSGRIGICEVCYNTLSPVPADSPMQGSASLDYIFSAYYYNEAIRNLIHRYKFYGEYRFSDLFSEMLWEYLENISELKKYDLITSVPLHRKRLFSRGFNQSELIAKRISDYSHITYERCIYRTRNTIAQSHLGMRDRIHNISDAFIADAKKVKDKKILLFDDIYTTGSTMESCANELKSKGALSVAGISLSKTY